MYIYCLADLFNLRLWRRGATPNAADLRDGLYELVQASLTSLKTLEIVPRELSVRLYGGWHEKNRGYTEIRGVAAKAISQIPRSGQTRVRIDLAEGPVSQPHLKFNETVRPAPPKLRPVKLDVRDICPRRAQCDLPILLAWMEGVCPTQGCEVEITDVLEFRQQKTVDTLMTADAVSICHRQEADAIIIASDDDDLVPALLAVRSIGLPAINLIRRPYGKIRYMNLLESQDIHLTQW